VLGYVGESAGLFQPVCSEIFSVPVLAEIALLEVIDARCIRIEAFKVCPVGIAVFFDALCDLCELIAYSGEVDQSFRGT